MRPPLPESVPSLRVRGSCGASWGGQGRAPFRASGGVWAEPSPPLAASPSCPNRTALGTLVFQVDHCGDDMSITRSE
jgi:hypothetical protein